MKLAVVVAVVVVVVVAAVTPSLPPPIPPYHPIDTSLCPATDSLFSCDVRRGVCVGVWKAVAPPSPLTTALACASSTNTTLPPHLFTALGALDGGEALLRTAPLAVQQCALNSTGLLEPTTMTVNRTTLASRLNSTFSSNPILASTLTTSATATCTTTTSDITPLLSCLVSACMSSPALDTILNATRASLGKPAAGVVSTATVSKSSSPGPTPMSTTTTTTPTVSKPAGPSPPKAVQPFMTF